jgi:hypothetical protein
LREKAWDYYVFLQVIAYITVLGMSGMNVHLLLC